RRAKIRARQSHNRNGKSNRGTRQIRGSRQGNSFSFLCASVSLWLIRGPTKWTTESQSHREDGRIRIAAENVKLTGRQGRNRNGKSNRGTRQIRGSRQGNSFRFLSACSAYFAVRTGLQPSSIHHQLLSLPPPRDGA